MLDEDDVCYYIGFTREEYSKVRETPPSALRTALWQTCANMAMLSLSVAGIDVDQLGEEVKEVTTTGNMDDGGSQKVSLMTSQFETRGEGGKEEGEGEGRREGEGGREREGRRERGGGRKREGRGEREGRRERG